MTPRGGVKTNPFRDLIMKLPSSKKDWAKRLLVTPGLQVGY